jgi:hypothetical protein
VKSYAPGVVALFVLLAFVAPADAQPGLSTLWPAEIGQEWEFDVRVEGPFDVIETGIVTQTVVGQSELSPGVTVWCFNIESSVSASALPGMPEGLSALEQRLWSVRPELREKLLVGRARRVAVQPSLLLRVPECSNEAGLLVDDEVAMGLWGSNGDWAWWWITADVTPGSTFRLQLVPHLADDVFVNGNVRTIDGAVTTPAGSFTNVVIVDYVIELGESIISDAVGTVLGTAFFETVGWVAFVPGVGPVASEEAFSPAEIDCPECPLVVFETVTTTMDLQATTVVPAERRSFGSLKAQF